jgi:hypothetical protein
MHIELRAGEFRWLWLKYVWGFDARYHCERCLVGHQSTVFREWFRQPPIPKSLDLELDEFESPFMYLCGVTAHYERNLHVAFCELPGSSIALAEPRLSLVISNAVQLPISPVAAPKPAAYLRCRNFQFGYHYLGQAHRHLLVVASGMPQIEDGHGIAADLHHSRRDSFPVAAKLVHTERSYTTR